MNSYVAATGRGIAEGVKKEWEHAQTFTGVIEYAIVGREVRAVYVASRVALAAGTGVVRGIKEVRQERRAVQQWPAPPLTVVPQPQSKTA